MEINKPIQRTYYILINGETQYGYIEPDQVLTNESKSQCETFIVEQEWLDRLLELGIDPNEEDIDLNEEDI